MAAPGTTNSILNGPLADAAGTTVPLRIPAGRVALLAALLMLLVVAGRAGVTLDPVAAYQAVDTTVRATVPRGERLVNDARLFYQLAGGKRILPAAADRVVPAIVTGVKTQLCKETAAPLKAASHRARS